MKKLVIGLFAVVLAVSLSGCKDKPEEKSKYQVGDVVLCDGTICRGSDKLFSMSEEEILKASAIIYKVDGKKAYGVLIPLPDDDVVWCPIDANLYSVFIDTIQCNVTEQNGNYSFEGDVDGSDNLDQLKKFFIDNSIENDLNNLLSGYLEALISLQPLQIAINLKDGGLYEDALDVLNEYPWIFGDWYVPSLSELYDIYKQKTLIYNIRRMLGYSEPDNSYMWSASTNQDHPTCAACINFEDGKLRWIDKAQKCQVFAIRVF